ncbi:MAG TPA: hypothetical protein VMK13_02330 [Streptosporangiaceae bacterium]|nr:hypothetical protein [Streptosporangiaceae bacterium]
MSGGLVHIEHRAAQGHQARGHFPGDDAVVKLRWLNGAKSAEGRPG